jgi:hypothetical protein
MTPLLNMLMGMKSFNGSYLTLWMSGAIAICATDATSRVPPSGLARAAYWVPIVPPAPARFSMMNGCGNTFVRWSASSLAVRSTMPPGS